eukprot:1472225-Amphidinium_carterae.1
MLPNRANQVQTPEPWLIRRPSLEVFGVDSAAAALSFMGSILHVTAGGGSSEWFSPRHNTGHAPR